MYAIALFPLGVLSQLALALHGFVQSWHDGYSFGDPHSQTEYENRQS